MDFSASASASFSASHTVPDSLRCGRLHGHVWTVTVTIRAGMDPAYGELIKHVDLAIAVESLCAELHREHLNSMMPGSPPTPAGVALAFREKLAMEFRTIESVRVAMDNEAATVHV